MTYLEWNCGSLCDVRLKITLREKKKHTHTQTYTLRERKREEPWTIKSNCKFLQTHIFRTKFQTADHSDSLSSLILIIHTHTHIVKLHTHKDGPRKAILLHRTQGCRQTCTKQCIHIQKRHTQTQNIGHSHAGKCNSCASVNLCFISFDILFLSLFLQLCIPFSLTLLSSGASQRGGGIRKEQMLYSVASLLLSFFHSGFCWNRKSLEILL